MGKSAFLPVFSIPYSVQKARAGRGKGEAKNRAWRGEPERRREGKIKSKGKRMKKKGEI